MPQALANRAGNRNVQPGVVKRNQKQDWNAAQAKFLQNQQRLRAGQNRNARSMNPQARRQIVPEPAPVVVEEKKVEEPEVPKT